MTPALISFIVPAHNEAQLIVRTLTAIQAAAHALAVPHEVIVVDDASSDETAALAAQAGARIVAVEVRRDRPRPQSGRRRRPR